MKRPILLFSIAVLAALACGNPALAGLRQRPAPDADNADVRSVSPAEKAASDDLMRQGLAKLQAASADIQAKNGAATLEDLRSAYAAMLAAKPIYHGHRASSLKLTRAAGLAVRANKSDAIQKATTNTAKAIAEADFALKYW